MDIMGRYNEVSKAEALKIEEVKEYKDSIDNGLQEVTNFRMNNKIGYKLLHPFKTIRNSYRYVRLIKSKKEFDKIMDTPVMAFEKESTGDVQQDLNNSTYKFKPEFIKNYVNSKR